jgi:hypothetical protein
MSNLVIYFLDKSKERVAEQSRINNSEWSELPGRRNGRETVCDT